MIDPDTKLRHFQCNVCGYDFESTTSHTSVAGHLITHDRHGDISLPKSISGDPMMKYKRGSLPFLIRLAALMHLIIGLNLSLATVDSPVMLQYSVTMDPAFTVPCQKTFREDILARANFLEEQLKQNLAVALFISLTADLWTAHQVPFIGLTVHFVTASFALLHRTIGVLEFRGSHTSKAIRKVVSETVGKFVSLERIVGITTDGASNMIAFGASTPFQRFSCFAHALQLIIRAGLSLPVIQALFRSCRRIAEFFKRSTPAQDAFHACQHTTIKRNLSIPCPTRWLGDYETLDEFVSLEAAIDEALLRLDQLAVDILDEDNEQARGPAKSSTTDTASQIHRGMANQIHSEVDLAALSIAPAVAQIETPHSQSFNGETAVGDDIQPLPLGSTAAPSSSPSAATYSQFSSTSSTPSGKRVFHHSDDDIRTFQDFANVTHVNFDPDLQPEAQQPARAKRVRSVRAADLILSSDDWILLKSLHGILQTYARRTILLQAPNCFLSDVAAQVINLERKWDHPASSLERDIFELMRQKSQRLKTFPFISITAPTSEYMVCLALDPRFKRFETISAVTWCEVKRQATFLIGAQHVNVNNASATSSLLDDVMGSQKRNDYLQSNQVDLELAMYLALPELSYEQNNQVLPFWEKNSPTLPLLSALARKYFCLQPTEVPSERLFSSAGRVFTDERASLDPSLLSAVVFIHENDEELIKHRNL